ncbi:MAG: hypothetical protein WDA42_03485 [Candidatus Bathyarchaeia archaeon]|jgi:hypothetical protein
MVKLLIDINQDTQAINIWAGNNPVSNVIHINLVAVAATKEDPDITFNCVFTVRREMEGKLININYYACDKNTDICNNNCNALKDIPGFIGIPVND